MSSEARRFTFLQISDLHLDSTQLATGFPLTLRQRAARAEELSCAFLASLAVAKERQVDAVLIVGDLFHNESVRSATVAKVIEGCCSLGDIPVFICPGNRDFFSCDSFYNNEALEIRGLPAWSGNVHIFKTSEFQTIQHPRRSDVSITARAFTSPDTVAQRLLSVPISRKSAEIDLLMFHGALDGYMGNDAERENKITSPFSIAELKAQNFTYAALGHYHDLTEVRLESGLLLGAYSGCLGGRSFYETGPRYAILASIEQGRPGRWNVHLEPIEVDSRRLIMAACDISGMSSDDVLEELSLSIAEQGGRNGTDLVFVHLEGPYARANDPAIILKELRRRFPELVVYDNTRPDFLAESYEPNSADSKFIEALLELKQRIEQARAGTEDDTNASGKIVEDALYYGLDALKQRRITIRNVD